MGQRPSQEELPAILGRALLNLRVPVAARRLMFFYASQAAGFRPSLKTIEDGTQIHACNIARHRKQLIDRGFLSYDGKEIVIDWVRLRAFAAMDSCLAGKPKSWRISPVDPYKCYGIVNSDLHNYREREFSAGDKLLLKRYEATAQAVANGVKFPELRGTDCEELTPKCYGIVKSDLHNYRGTGVSAEWYNPFDKPDPPWVWRLVVDGNRRIMGFAHDNRSLPF